MVGGGGAQIHDARIAPLLDAFKWANKAAIVNFQENPHAMDGVHPNVLKARSISRQKYIAPRREGKIDWCLINLPSPAEAKIDRMPFKDYVSLFMDAANRDWPEVEKTQEILIEKLDAGTNLELIADAENGEEKWRTHLTMSIEGMTFANSTIRRNFPGSEAFSAPVRGTVNGRLALPYPVMFKDILLPNLILYFEKGKVVDHFTSGDMEKVRKILDTDPGAREVGEVAFGTNPVLNRPLLNSLLVEKVGGSFHIALGNAHETKIYNGKEVKINNGVKSANHIDLTRMMQKKFGGGKVILDGEIISLDGRFTDPRLEILNPPPNRGIIYFLGRPFRGEA